MLRKILSRWKERHQRPLDEETEIPQREPDEELIKRMKTVLRERATACHEQVVESYADWGLNVGPIPLLILPPGAVNDLSHMLESKGELPRMSGRDSVGLYDSGSDIIFMDGGHVLENDDFEVRRVIGHEYGHRVYARFMHKAQQRRRPDPRAPIAALSTTSEAEYEGAFYTQSEADALRKRIFNERTRPLTRNDLRRLEFDVYFEERFVESLSAFMNNHTTADATLYMHSRSHKGELLCSNSRFFEGMERGLHKAFYERMFTRGPKNVIAELPFTYRAARKAFERAYREQLPGGIRL